MNPVDIAIIGTGPAGISAALNAKIRNKSFLLFGSRDLSHKVHRSHLVSNYPGLPQVSGDELNAAFRRQLEEMEIEITEKRITGIYNMGDYFAMLADQEEFDARTVILATGVEAVKPLPGEGELLGRGVSYCATCDGNLFRGKTIAVVCDNLPMEEEAAYLSELAGKVYYQPLFQGSEFTAPNAERLASPLAEVVGTDGRVSAIRCRDGQELPLDGVFFLKQSISPAILLRDLKTDSGHVVVDRTMATNIPGCFAAGDCTGLPYQITKATGEGNIALHSALSYLNAKKA
jgi:thioredoxin reductase (NADPH)